MKLHMTRKTFLAGLSAVAVTGWNRLFAECRPFGAGVRMPSGRIQRLLARALDHDVRPEPVAVEYDPADLNLPEPVRIGKRLKEYISAQPVTIRADEELVGWLSAVNWRLSRFARMRDDMKLAGDLEENNSALKRMLTAVENERMRTFMQMTPREGLHMALSRADFTEAEALRGGGARLRRGGCRGELRHGHGRALPRQVRGRRELPQALPRPPSGGARHPQQPLHHLPQARTLQGVRGLRAAGPQAPAGLAGGEAHPRGHSFNHGETRTKSAHNKRSRS